MLGESFRPTSQSSLKQSHDKAISANNLAIRRNIYDSNGKDLTPAITKAAAADGEAPSSTDGAGGTNGNINLSAKAIESIAKEPRKPVYCSSCGVECSKIRMHHAATTTSEGKKAPLYDLCPQCYQNGRFVNGHESTGFVQLQDTSYDHVPDTQSPWSDAEVLLLLEALETEDDNWSRIADHVRTRTREECVLKFLQLEIEDSYLEDQAPAQEQRFGPLDYQHVPFTQADNPVMSVVAFLAGLTDPATVKAATGRSIDVLSKKMQARIENGYQAPDETKREATHGKSAESTTEPTVEEVAASKGKAPEIPAPASGTDITTTAGQPDPANDPSTMDIDTHPDPQPLTTTTTTTTTSSHLPHPQPTTSLPTLALTTTATRAFALASNEEREMTRHVSSAVNLQLKKIELKMKHFEELELVLAREKRELEEGRRELFLERVKWRREVEVMGKGGSAGAGAGAGMGGGGGRLQMVGQGEEGEGMDVQPFSAEEGGMGARSLEL